MVCVSVRCQQLVNVSGPRTCSSYRVDVRREHHAAHHMSEHTDVPCTIASARADHRLQQIRLRFEQESDLQEGGRCSWCHIKDMRTKYELHATRLPHTQPSQMTLCTVNMNTASQVNQADQQGHWAVFLAAVSVSEGHERRRKDEQTYISGSVHTGLWNKHRQTVRQLHQEQPWLVLHSITTRLCSK